jgi:hypothetical protein
MIAGSVTVVKFKAVVHIPFFQFTNKVDTKLTPIGVCYEQILTQQKRVKEVSEPSYNENFGHLKTFPPLGDRNTKSGGAVFTSSFLELK